MRRQAALKDAVHRTGQSAGPMSRACSAESLQSLRDAVTEAEATLLKIQQEMLARASSEAALKSAEGFEAAGNTAAVVANAL